MPRPDPEYPEPEPDSAAESFAAAPVNRCVCR